MLHKDFFFAPKEIGLVLLVGCEQRAERFGKLDVILVPEVHLHNREPFLFQVLSQRLFICVWCYLEQKLGEFQSGPAGLIPFADSACKSADKDVNVLSPMERDYAA